MFLAVALSFLFVVSVQAEIIEDELEITTYDGYLIQARVAYLEGTSPGAPGILFIPGGGATSINGTAEPGALPNYRDLALELANRGYVVLRYGKRGVYVDEDDEPYIEEEVYNTLNPPNLVADGWMALWHIRNHVLTNPSRVGVIGKSESSIVAPMVAIIDRNVPALAIMSPVGRDFASSAYHLLVEYPLKCTHRFVDINNDYVLDSTEFDPFPHIFNFPFEYYDRNSDGTVTMAELTGKLIAFKDYMLETFDDPPSLTWTEPLYQNIPFFAKPNYKRIPMYTNPILVIGAALDVTTPVEETYMIEDALLEDGRTNVTVEIVPGVGHDFSPPIGSFDEIETSGPYDPIVYDILDNWLYENL